MADNKVHDIFISYSWKIKSSVDDLFAFLSFNDFSIWMDRERLNAGCLLCDELQKAILEAKVIIACVNRDYLNSPMCNKEIQYACRLKKPIILVFFDDLSEEELENIKPLISGLVRIRAFESLGDWSGEIGTHLLNAIENVFDRKITYKKPNVAYEEEDTEKWFNSL